MDWETISAFFTTREAGSLGILVLALLLAGSVRWLRLAVLRLLRSSDSESLIRQVFARFLDDIRGVVALVIVVGGVYLALTNLSLWGADNQRPAGWFGAVALGLTLIAAVRIARSFVSVFTEQLEQQMQTPEQLRVLRSIVPQVHRASTSAIVIVGALIILEQVGIPVAPLLAGLGIGGLAVALAAQSTLANLLAGLSIFIDGTVRVGDMVELDDGQRGFVEDVGWRTTKLRLPANNLVIIPNGKLADSIMTNYQMPNDEVSVYVPNGVAYDSDLDQVEEITLEVANQLVRDTPGAATDFAPIMRYTEFADSNINFTVIMRAKDWPTSRLMRHRFIKAVKRRYDKEGIEIAFPARNIYVRDDAGLTAAVASTNQRRDGAALADAPPDVVESRR
ncbi:MAG: mechanosensitive ion channel protein MscS [Dehalococcoidia bacterium]|nr:mechanosensitive ion channel protein MscS [Dehalococcoidia bacterium]